MKIITVHETLGPSVEERKRVARAGETAHPATEVVRAFVTNDTFAGAVKRLHDYTKAFNAGFPSQFLAFRVLFVTDCETIGRDTMDQAGIEFLDELNFGEEFGNG